MQTVRHPLEHQSEAPPPVWQTVGRWVLVLPGAIVGGVAAFWAAKLLNWLGSSRVGNDSWGWHLWTTAFEGLAQGYAFVLAAAWIAPAGKRPVAISMAAVLIFLTGGSAILVLPKREWITLWSMTAVLVGSVVAATQIAKERD